MALRLRGRLRRSRGRDGLHAAELLRVGVPMRERGMHPRLARLLRRCGLFGRQRRGRVPGGLPAAPQGLRELDSVYTEVPSERIDRYV